MTGLVVTYTLMTEFGQSLGPLPDLNFKEIRKYDLKMFNDEGTFFFDHNAPADIYKALEGFR